MDAQDVSGPVGRCEQVASLGIGDEAQQWACTDQFLSRLPADRVLECAGPAVEREDTGIAGVNVVVGSNEDVVAPGGDPLGVLQQWHVLGGGENARLRQHRLTMIYE